MSAKTATHKCPCDNCAVQVARHLLMCLPHWRMVPKALQSEVYRTFRAWSHAPLQGSGKYRREYVEVVRSAIAAVREKEVKRQMKRDSMGDVLKLE